MLRSARWETEGAHAPRCPHRSDHVRETLCKLSAQRQLHAAEPVLVADPPWGTCLYFCGYIRVARVR